MYLAGISQNRNFVFSPRRQPGERIPHGHFHNAASLPMLSPCSQNPLPKNVLLFRTSSVTRGPPSRFCNFRRVGLKLCIYERHCQVSPQLSHGPIKIGPSALGFVEWISLSWMLLLGLCAFLFNVLSRATLNKYLNGPKKFFVGFFF